MPGQMKALVYEGPREMNVRQVPVPAPKDDEVLIRVSVAGICGSELSGYLGKNSLRKPPLVMGHEFAGTIAEAGRTVTGFRAGDRVTVNPLVSCMACSDCFGGQAHLCANRKLLGAHLPGAYAEYVVVPARNVYRLPDALDFGMAALAEPFGCAVHIARLARLTPSDRLLIVGAGPIGILVLQAARLFGVENVVVQDLNAERLEIVRELGGIPVSGEAELKAASQGEPFHACVDAVGLDVTRQQCVNQVRQGGRVIFSGLHAADSQLPINDIIRKEIGMKGAFAYSPNNFATALEWIAQGKVRLQLWMKEVPLEEGQASFELLLGNPGRIAKILLSV